MALFLFKTDLRPAAFTLPNNQRFSLALGASTFVHWTSTQSLTFAGLLAVGGNVDGMVVCFSNENSSAFTLSCTHEDSGNEATPSCRFNTSGHATVNAAQGGSLWFRYNGVTARWHQIGKD